MRLVSLSFRRHHCHLLLLAQCWQRAAAELCLPRTLLLVGPLALQPHISSALCTWSMGLVSGLWDVGCVLRVLLLLAGCSGWFFSYRNRSQESV